MKILLGTVLFFGAAGFLMYQFGGVESFDPKEQYDQARKAIQPGMSWKQVVSAVRAPKKFRPMIRSTETNPFDGQPIEVVKPGLLIKFDEKAMSGKMQSGELADGFIFQYQFSPADAISVHFDGGGNVVGMADMFTVADLLYPDRRSNDAPAVAQPAPGDLLQTDEDGEDVEEEP